MANGQSITVDILEKDSAGLLNEWLAEMKATGAGNDGRMTEAELTSQGTELLKGLSAAVRSGDDISATPWAGVREFLEDVSRSRAIQGFSSEEIATFIFSLKKPLFTRIRRATANNPEALAEATWQTNQLIDKLGMHTVKVFQKSREEVIRRQQEEMLELSTPVVKLWDGIIALPMIGTLDSARTQIVMESLLERIVETGAEIAIIDITGVPTVDTLVAQHLLKTVTAIRLMGADCIISGIRPQIAQTIVHLGVELQGVMTKASLADALALALKRTGLTVTKVKPA
jgi:rsbT co-antagonist protein RsbR